MACRFRNRKLDPYRAKDATELADSTITSPIPVSRNAAVSSTATVRGRGSRSARATRRSSLPRRSPERSRSRRDGRSSSRTTRSRGRGAREVRAVPAPFAPLALLAPARLGTGGALPVVAGIDARAVPVRPAIRSPSLPGAGPGRRQLARRSREPLAALGVVAEHVLAGTGRSEDHGATGGRHGERAARRLLDRRRGGHGNAPVEHPGHLQRGLADGH